MSLKRNFISFFIVITLFSVLIPSPANGKTLILKLGNTNSPELPISKGVYQFSELAKKESQGQCIIEIIPQRTLGPVEDVFEMVKKGILDLALLPTPLLSRYVRQTGILELPFAFRTYKDADRFIEGDGGKSVLKLFLDIGLIGLSYYEHGMVGIATRKIPVKKVGDYRGLGILVNSREIVFSSIRQLGATPIRLPSAEVYVALERGLGDSSLITPLFFDLRGYEKVTRYFSLTNHFYSAQILIINKQKFDSLPKNLQQIITRVGVDTARYQRELSREIEKNILDKMESKSVGIVRNPDVIGMQEAMKPIYAENKSLWAGLLDCAKCPFPPWCCN